jgi:hypothetical protein
MASGDVSTLAYGKADVGTGIDVFWPGYLSAFGLWQYLAFRRSRFCSIATNSSRALETRSSNSSRLSEALGGCLGLGMIPKYSVNCE